MDHRPAGDAPSTLDRAVAPGAAAGVLATDLAARLDRWVAEARVDDAARRRARERWLRQQAEEEASLAGVLADLAERGTPVTLHGVGGRRHRGTVRAVGEDFVVVSTATRDAVVALGSVTSVRTRPGEAPAVGDRSVSTPLRLAEVLAGLAAEREAADLVTRDGGDSVTGVVRSVGRDVVVVQLATGSPAVAYVPIAAIAEVLVGA
jgi:hypothetical protein